MERSNACALPGCTIKYDTFLPIMWRAVARGFVEHRYAVFVANGLRHGFEAGVQRHLLRGQRVFKNYKSAVEAMPQVARATQKRIDSGKTLMLRREIGHMLEIFRILFFLCRDGMRR